MLSQCTVIHISSRFMLLSVVVLKIAKYLNAGGESAELFPWNINNCSMKQFEQNLL